MLRIFISPFRCDNFLYKLNIRTTYYTFASAYIKSQATYKVKLQSVGSYSQLIRDKVVMYVVRGRKA